MLESKKAPRKVVNNRINKSNKKSYSKVFGETLSKAAETDEKIIAITAAMMSGPGLDIFNLKHPNIFLNISTNLFGRSYYCLFFIFKIKNNSTSYFI